MKSVLCLVFALVLGIVNARTVALWPLEARDGSFNGVNLVNASEGLTLSSGNEVIDSELGWEIPPNPDTGLKWCEEANRSCVRRKGTENRLLSNEKSGRLLARDRNFTIEGWVKIHGLPDVGDVNTVDGKSIIIAANETSGHHRWALMFCKGDGECSWQFWYPWIADTPMKRYVGDEAIEGITNTWVHVAVTHQIELPTEATGEARETWGVYLDGEKIGTFNANVSLESLAEVPTKRFDLGGRDSYKARIAYASFDYWRISDEVLPPEAFLCAGGAGTQAAAEYEKTLAYWPLDVNRDGSINTWDALDGAPLSSGFWKREGDLAFCEMRPSAESAFEGNPPNASVDLKVGNTGSLMGAKNNTALVMTGLGSHLTCTNDWTVEGWLRPMLIEREAGKAFQGVIWATRVNYECGWIFSLDYAVDGTVKFMLYSNDDGSALLNNVVIGEDLRAWENEWKHLALVHRAESGSERGRWTVYLDGVKFGEAVNGRAVREGVNGYSASFGIGGRLGAKDRGFQGGIDCVRVSRAALAPSQFMCTQGGTAANDVLALWPLNVRDGAYFDLRDSVGDYDFVAHDSSFDAEKQAKPVENAERPEVTNPDPSTNFRGSRTGGKGAVMFRDVLGKTGQLACLVSEGRELADQMAGHEGWTFECYYNMTDSVVDSDKQQVIFSQLSGDSSVSVRFFMRNEAGGKGWTISEQYHANISDTTFEDTAWEDVTKGVWHHLALTKRFVEEDGVRKVVWNLFIDGVQKKAQAEGRVQTQYPAKPRGFMIGGRSWRSDNIFRGMLSHVRVSKGVLTPYEFLNASRADVPAPTTTLAYWPIDSVGGTVNGASLIAPAYDFEAGEGVTGQDAKARASVPRPDTSASLVGNAKANVGSVAAADGAALTAGGIGFGMELARSFTLEGWMKWTAGDAERDLLLRIGGDGKPGVKVWIETVDGQKKMRVRGRAEFPSSVLVNGVFDWDFTQVSGAWCHVALARAVDAGSWTLYVDGVEVGTVYDYWKVNATETFGNGDFCLLGSGAGTEFDMWRVTAGVRAPDAFLFDKVRGTLIFIK